MTNLATKVRGLRGAKGLGRAQLANRAPIERSYLWQIENGRQVNLGRRILRGLANALDVRLDYLDDDSIDETRSWEKVAADESLELFLKISDIREEEKVGLRRVSFTQSSPRTVKEWEQFWNGLKAYFQPRRSGQSSRNRPRSGKNVNSSGSLGDPPAAGK